MTPSFKGASGSPSLSTNDHGGSSLDGSGTCDLTLPDEDKKAPVHTYWGLKLQALFLKVRVYLMKKNR